jgi:predicted AAA+ superfamily ATPase
LFPLLRVLADRRPLPARFLVLGSASPDLRRQSSESLAGRVLYHNLSGLTLAEVGEENLESLWLRGGFPESFVAVTDPLSSRWRTQFIETYLARDLAALGYPAPPQTMRRFWTMLAHLHGQHLNISKLADALGETHQATRRYLDALASTYMVTQLLPWFNNVGKRQVKAPKVYVGDSGMLHALLKIASHHDLLAHPVVGASWESFAMVQIQQQHGLNPIDCYYWGLYSRAEIDMVTIVGGQPVGYEFKVSSTPKTTKSMHSAIETLGLQKLYVVHPGADSWPMGNTIEALGLGQPRLVL